MPATIRAAIVGCGVIAPTHAKAIALDRRASLVLACDLDPVRAGALGAQRISTDWRDCLAEDIDLVVLCTPHHLHVEQGLQVLASGKHLLVEKPLGTEPQAVGRLVAAAQSGRSVASGIFQHRFAPLARRLKQLADGGDLGELRAGELRFRCIRTAEYYASGPWRGRWAGEGGALMSNQAIHTIDLMTWRAGPPGAVAGTVCAPARGHQRVRGSRQRRWCGCAEPPGAADVRLDCANDLVTDWEMGIRLQWSHGMVELGRGHRLVALEHPSDALQAELRGLDQVQLDGVRLPGKECYGDHHALQMQDVLGAILAGRRPFVSIEDAAMTNQLVLGLYASSARGGRPVALPADGFTRPQLVAALQHAP